MARYAGYLSHLDFRSYAAANPACQGSGILLKIKVDIFFSRSFDGEVKLNGHQNYFWANIVEFFEIALHRTSQKIVAILPLSRNNFS